MFKIIYTTLFVLLILLTSCEEAVDKCKFIEITKNSDFEKYEDCTVAEGVAIYGETTHVNGLNNLIEVKDYIYFSEPDDESEDEKILVPIESITGFKKLKKFGQFYFGTFTHNELKEFDTFQEVTEIGSFTIGCNHTNILNDCGPRNLLEINAFDKLVSVQSGISITGKNIEKIPDFNSINDPNEIILGLPNIKKIPTFNSLKNIYNNISVNFCGNFSESEVEAEFSGINSENYGDNYLQIYDQCD